MAESPFATTTVEAFIDCMEGNDLTQPVDSKKFTERLLGHGVDESFMRKLFNAFHSTCPNFKEGEDDCPDCWANRNAIPC